MPTPRALLATCALAASLALLPACATHVGGPGSGNGSGNPSGNDVAGDASASSDVATGDVQGAPGHTDNQAGVLHAPGKADPLQNCVGCHGAKLKGDAGPSCYSCHDSGDHTVNREGTKHRSGSESSCTACHGPGNKGGLGRACSACHGQDD